MSCIPFLVADPIPELQRTELRGLLVLSQMWVITESQNGPEGTVEVTQLHPPAAGRGTGNLWIPDPVGWEEGTEQAEKKKREMSIR